MTVTAADRKGRRVRLHDTPAQPRPLVILYRSNTKPAHSTENQIASALRRLGHEVIPLQEDLVPWEDTPRIAAETGAQLHLHTCTWHEDYEGGQLALKELKEMGVVTASAHLDLYVGLIREATIDGDPFWASDVVFTADGAHDTWFADHGIDHVWMRPGVDILECRLGVPQPPWIADVGFVGSYLRYHDEWPYRRKLVDWLRASYRQRFRLFGHDGVASVRGAQLADAVASVKVWVGDSLCPDPHVGSYWSDRAAEIVGRGGFLIHPWIAGLDDEFVDGEHVRYYTFGDFDGLAKLIRHYLAHPAEARQIGLAGQWMVRERCTWDVRMTGVLAELATRFPQLSESSCLVT